MSIVRHTFAYAQLNSKLSKSLKSYPEEVRARPLFCKSENVPTPTPVEGLARRRLATCDRLSSLPPTCNSLGESGPWQPGRRIPSGPAQSYPKRQCHLPRSQPLPCAGHSDHLRGQGPQGARDRPGARQLRSSCAGCTGRHSTPQNRR